MNRLLLSILLISFSLFTQSKDCLSINDISVRLDDNSTVDSDVSKFNIYHNNKVLFSYEALEVDNNVNNVECSDLDFDGKKEIILRVDNEPSHDVEYAVLKLKCDKLEMHTLFPEIKEYERLSDKRTKIYYKNGYSIKEKIYCFQSTGYLCEEKYIIGNNYELRKPYSSNGKVIAADIYYNQKKLTPNIKEKSYLYYDLNKKSNMYLVKGDKVSILDEKTAPNGQSWYFINYKGKKEINMWIEADSVDLN
ncbi:hypothetical protein BBH51_06545 [Aggregatibacter actinomycetemcomitans]|uniref:SH3 domain-containing protein n=1 Tax=Aggregatibacter actinomycetemcomitans TaxID=714 RepID=A0A142FXE5_AGGAC|nr:hypothetical protein [Aggregatibacter actinomycetemcomitans]AFI85966.1 hypothetical protein D7S_00083 [Aggregatibacter actinomycetemcomitans D7S-1]AMQ93075.1 hypothetical protein ACT75_00265 [Aggregatibacter actinomycetemcomitans]ANU82336.1 hypothetical protein BBH51_06545 [Aggregatibacter actinomycetemcomitans]EKX98541.1 hypothetical protein HMPREF9996_00354 [Aggregatibacter actinomycetemcomitans Y4]KND82684.1 hypothetical protein H5P1_0210670 [Aggregatibacter actinomycetemcomitans serotyp